MKILKRYKSEFSFKNLNINDKIILIQLCGTRLDKKNLDQYIQIIT